MSKEPTFGELLMSTIRDIAATTLPHGILDCGKEESADEDSYRREQGQ